MLLLLHKKTLIHTCIAFKKDPTISFQMKFKNILKNACLKYMQYELKYKTCSDCRGFNGSMSVWETFQIVYGQQRKSDTEKHEALWLY